ncbi:MAG: inositol monophosphatase [Chloroflexi bacterium]|nr:inositol monophosphatase [Chloroflexota bacterium]
MALDAAFLAELEARAVGYARGAGDILLRHFDSSLEVRYKSGGKHDPVTNADRESEEYLRAAISAAYPDHSILGEEGDDHQGSGTDFLWVLDPLDGTTNYLNRLPFFAVSVGVLYRGEPVAAAIYVPTSGLLQEGVFHARLGGPTSLDGNPVQVASNPTPQPSQLTSLPAHYWRRMRFSGEIRRAPGEVRALGSIALELALTASGTLQYAIFDFPRIWDVAAGVLLVKQAGGLALLQPGRGRPWAPLGRFEPRPVKDGSLGGYRKWSGTVVVGNPEIAWAVATSLRRPVRILAPVRAALRRVRQLPLWGRSPSEAQGE